MDSCLGPWSFVIVLVLDDLGNSTIEGGFGAIVIVHWLLKLWAILILSFVAGFRAGLLRS
jgi:hypothetical protein